MAKSNESFPGRIPAPISSKLGGLRRSLSLWLLVNGLSRLLIALVILAAVDFGLDRFFEMDFYQRLIILVLISGVLIGISFWGLVRPFFSSTRDDALCLEIEKRHKGLRESLISAVQFARLGSLQYQGVSQAMVDATVEQGTRQAQGISFGSVLDKQKLLVNLCLLTVALVAIGFGAYKVRQEGSMLSIWFNRNVTLGNAEYPKRTYLTFPDIQGNKLVIPRGEEYTLRVQITEDSKQKDVAVSLDYLDSGERSSQEMRRTENTSIYEFERVFKNVSTEFQFRARGGDAITRWIMVSLVEPPSVTDLHLKVHQPAYSYNPSLRLVRKVREDLLTAAAGMEVDAAQVEQQRAQVAKLEEEIVGQNSEQQLQAALTQLLELSEWVDRFTPAPDAAEDPAWTLVSNVRQIARSTVSELEADAAELEGSGPHSILLGSNLTLTANANKPLRKAVLETPGGKEINLLEAGQELRLTAEIPADQLITGKYRFLLEDSQGLTTSKPASFDIKIRADRPPLVRARLQGVSGLIVSNAIVPISATIRDDFAVTKSKMVYNWKGDSSDSVAQTGELAFENIDAEEYGIAQMTIAPEMDLEPLKIPAGAGLRFVIAAEDNDIISGPNVGESTEFLLRVVTDDELRTDLLRREKELREEFERMLKEQEDLLTECEAMAADTVEGVIDVERYYSEKRKDLISFKRRQKILGTNHATVASRFQELLTEALNNRLDDATGRVRRRLSDGIIQPMETISQYRVPEVLAQLEQSRRTVQEPAEWKVAIDATVAEQQKIVDEMKQILTQMAESESYQEAVNLLRSIEKAEGELMARVKKEKADRIKAILEGTNKDNKEPPDNNDDSGGNGGGGEEKSDQGGNE